MPSRDELDPVFSADRDRGATPPESGEESLNVVGRPVDAKEHRNGVHESTETSEHDREAFSTKEALVDGGSFDGLGLPVADDGDAESPAGQR